jgi:hypothetical protein
MKMKKLLPLLLLASLALVAGPLAAAEGSIYGHFSFVDNGATVLRVAGGESLAAVNVPLAPGDTVVTPANGRCELQFDNGTVVRLDKETRLRLATVLAPALTSNWRITTLELEKGQLYVLPQTYNRELFQVVTANAAVKLRHRVRAYIRLDADGGTSFFSDGGCFQVLYGADRRSLRTGTVKTGRSGTVTTGHVLAAAVPREIEFMAWNEFIDRHFRDLHYGISKVPPKLKFGNTALTHWAEKWSSRFGEWIYDDIFGYVWRPADENFAFSARPFYHAEFTRFGGQLFLVPVESWAWVPAHMGTWVWLKRGWAWIPGDWFHNGVVSDSRGWMFPTFDYFWRLYSNWDRPQAIFTPEPSIYPESPPRPVKPGVPVLPQPVIGLLRKVGKVVAADAEMRLALERTLPVIDRIKLPPVPAPLPAAPVAADQARVRVKRAGDDVRSLARDWNPDSRWAGRVASTIGYSSSRNAVVCPERNLASDSLHGSAHIRMRILMDGWRQGNAPAGQPAGGTSSPEVTGNTNAPPPVPADQKEKKDPDKGH